MSSQIFISRNGEQYGPYDEGQLGQMMQSGNLVAEDLAWYEGLSEWVPLQSLLAGNARADAATAPRPSTSASNGTRRAPARQIYRPPGAEAVIRRPDDGDIPRPWRRYFARTFDFVANLFLLALVSEAAGFGEFLDNANRYVFALIVCVEFFFIEATLLALTGTTLGKFLFGLHIERHDGKKPGWGQAFSRGWDVLIRGYGGGIPVISFVTCFIAYQTLTNEGRTPWDDSRDLRVLSPPRKWWVWLLIWFGTFVFIGLILAALVAVEMTLHPEGEARLEP